MICSVCLNPCIDRTVEIDAFAYGGLNRIRASRSDGCGKGVNVALVAREMGMEASVIGFLFEENGRCIAERLESAGAGEDCIWLPGAVRTNLKVFDRSTARITEINEPGEQIPEEALARMVQKVREYAEICDTMVFTGSLPPGVPADFYRTLIEATAGCCRCVLDAEGEKLARGKRLEGWELEHYRAHRAQIDLRPEPTAAERAEKERLLRMLDGKIVGNEE